MGIPDFEALLQSADYDFLRNNARFGNRVMLLGLSGSYGYGTNKESSDIDFRGVTQQLPSDLLGLTAFEQYVDVGTDTVIFGFNKMIRLLLECNPNIFEVLGLPAEKYMIVSPLGQELLDNRRLFLSKRAIKAFYGYANAQLRRLQNAIARDALSQSDRERHILNSVQNALNDFNRKNDRVAGGRMHL